MRAVLAALARLETGQTQLRVDLMARMDGLANRLTAIQDDIAVNFGASENVRRANDHTRDELRAMGDMVASIERQVLRLRSEMDDLKGRQS